MLKETKAWFHMSKVQVLVLNKWEKPFLQINWKYFGKNIVKKQISLVEMPWFGLYWPNKKFLWRNIEQILI